ncbi:serine hydrolase domain-containing protein [Mesorhizobium abyssinicae]|uniref:serine hydrolase domain-containing protein n=1 Tax=Mesorhizobium abyssinicae TaxID=1209958 RepID=UPI003391E437
MILSTIVNPDLVAGSDQTPRWNVPEYRRRGFHNLHTIARYTISLRAPRVLPLRKQINWKIGDRPNVARFLAVPHFSAFVVVRDDRILYEAYARDFGPDQPHPLMSITKTMLNLMLGRLVADGLVSLDDRVTTYLPEIGSGYAKATVGALADMNVANDYDEYGAPFSTWNYAVSGFVLPPEGGKEETFRSWVSGITGHDLINRTGYELYKSANSEVLGWIIERVSGRSLRDWLIEIVEAAGLEGRLHIVCDREGVPEMSGGACLSACDLARYGLLFARMGAGLDGRNLGDADFIEDVRRNPGPSKRPPLEWLRYSRHLFTDGVWLGHGGSGGQFLLANPETGTVVVYFSVLESESGHDSDFTVLLVRMMAEVAAE